MISFNFFQKNKTYKHCCLIDNETNSLLVVGKNFNSMSFLKEYTLDTMLINLKSSKGLEEYFFDKLMSLESCYLLSWDFKSNSFIKSKNNLHFLREKSVLTRSKYSYLSTIMSDIVSYRNRITKTLAYQEMVYLRKRFQAERFKDRGYPENELLDFPYVLQYADLKKISLKDSADQILFQATLQDEMFSKTELLRLKFFNKIREASSVFEVEETYKEFLLDINVRI